MLGHNWITPKKSNTVIESLFTTIYIEIIKKVDTLPVRLQGTCFFYDLHLSICDKITIKYAYYKTTVKGVYKMKGFLETVLIILGTIFIALGVLGIFLPLLPTTPFLLLGASCYIKSSPRLYNWLIENKFLGWYIKNYTEGNGIPRKTKITAVLLLWVTISYSLVFIIDNLYIRACLVLIATGVTWHIISRKTIEQTGNKELSETLGDVNFEYICNENEISNIEFINKENK
jgi:uncharacterized protein